MTPELLPWAGIAAGVLIILIGSRASAQVAPNSLVPVTLISAFAPGLVAVLLSTGGARAGIGSSCFSSIFSLGVTTILMIWPPSWVGGNDPLTGFWPLAIAHMGVVVLPAVALRGALGGGFRKPSARSPAPPDQDRDGDGRSYCELQ